MIAKAGHGECFLYLSNTTVTLRCLTGEIVVVDRFVRHGFQILLGVLEDEIANADAAAKVMSEAGFEVSTATVDISSRASIMVSSNDPEWLASKAITVDLLSKLSTIDSAWEGFLSVDVPPFGWTPSPSLAVELCWRYGFGMSCQSSSC